MEAAAVCDLFHCQDWPGGGSATLQTTFCSFEWWPERWAVVRTLRVWDLIKGIFACRVLGQYTYPRVPRELDKPANVALGYK